MLARATAQYSEDPQVELRPHDLEQELKGGPVDAVVSGLAIHHLENDRKRTLFREIAAVLAPGGVFANLDLVQPASGEVHERFRRDIGRVEDDPTDRLAGLAEQMQWLEDAGLERVDCHFKWLELALIVAVKPD